jgi:hypothetical protein
MPFLPPPPTLREPRSLPLVAGDARSPIDLATPATKRGNDGFEYTRWKQVAYTIFTIGQVLFLPLWPLFLARESKDWSIARNYFGTMRYCLRAVWDHIAYGSLTRMIKYNITNGPDSVRKKIAQRRGSCTRCAKCCRGLNCIFLGHDARSGDYFCKVFGTAYWYYGTCGRYPIDQLDVDDHGCPGFSFPVTDEEMRLAKRNLPPKKLPVVSR